MTKTNNPVKKWIPWQFFKILQSISKNEEKLDFIRREKKGSQIKQ